MFLRFLARIVCLGLVGSVTAIPICAEEAPAASWATFLSASREGILASRVLANPAGGFYLYSIGDRPLMKFNADGRIAWEVRREVGVSDVREVIQADIVDNGDLIAIVGANGERRVFGQQFATGSQWLVRLRAADASAVFVKPLEGCEVTVLHARPGGGYLVGGFTLGPARIGSDQLSIPTNCVFVAQFRTGLDWIATGEWKGFGDSVKGIRSGGSGANFRVWAGGDATQSSSFGGKTLGRAGAYVVQLGVDGTVIEARALSTNDFASLELTGNGRATFATSREALRLYPDCSTAWRKEFAGQVTAVTAGDEAYVAGWKVGASFVVALDAVGNEKWRREEFSRSVNIATGAARLSIWRPAIVPGRRVRVRPRLW